MPASNRHVLIVDDEKDIRTALREYLLEEDSFTVTDAESGAQALAILQGPEGQRPDLVVLDHYLSDMEGTVILQKMLDDNIDIPVILLTGNTKAAGVIKATQLGAVAYLSKPTEMNILLDAMNQALRQAKLRQENVMVKIPDADPTEKIIGRGAEMMKIFQTIGLVAQMNTTLLITGENGTGKSLLAETIHNSSNRKTKPFIAFNCAGLSENLLESELFGHEKGSFSGAITRHIGKFEAADTGTIFLDEIGEMSMSMQSKLLTVLQSQEFQRVGGTETIKVNVRIITATNKNLPLRVQEGRYREDLYFRISAFPIHMPPLRDRKQDIPALVAHFMEMHRFSPVSPPARISQGAIEKLFAYDWPGNIRELGNVIQRAVIYSRGELILPEHINFGEDMSHFILDILSQVKNTTSIDALVATTKQMAVQAALRLSENNLDRAAALLEMSSEDFTQLRSELDA